MSWQREETLCTGCAMSCLLTIEPTEKGRIVSGGACPKGKLLFEEWEKRRQNGGADLKALFLQKLEKNESKTATLQPNGFVVELLCNIKKQENVHYIILLLTWRENSILFFPKKKNQTICL